MIFNIHRGTNISHWLSQSKRRGAERRAWFTRDDARKLAGLGLDHLRLPIDEEQFWDAGGRREPEAWDLLNAGLDWCREAGLRAVVDLHILRSHFFNQRGEPALFTDPGAAEQFAGLWRDLARGLRSRSPDQVAYELLNEPVAKDPEDWNRVALRAYAVLREQEPGRVIVLGSNRCNSPATFDALRVPADDPLLMLTFHYYAPLLITHHRAAWWELGPLYSGPLQYPGAPIPAGDLARLPEPVRRQLEPANAPHDAGAMERDLAPPLAARARTGLRLYCGEFGALHTAPDAIRRAWYRDFRSVLARHRIAWANWDYKGGFGIFAPDGAPTVAAEELFPDGEGSR